MTYYEYAGEMQELCFKISQAQKVLGETGLYDFYYTTSTGFEELREKMSVEEADRPIDKNQEETLENTGAYLKEVQKEATEKHYIANTTACERRTITLEDFSYLMFQAENDLYYIKDIFRDYLGMLAQSEHDIHSEYWRHPKNLVHKHDELRAELEEKERRRKMMQQKERAKTLNEIAKKFAQYDTNIDGYRIFVTTDFSVWEKHAKALSQCICACGYYDKVADGEEILVFICKGKKHIATAEVKPDKTIGQFYADERDRENCLPTAEVKAAFEKWLKMVPKSKFKKKAVQKKAA